jgi:hypothetical protein
VFRGVELALRDIGLSLDVWTAKLSGIEIFRNIYLDQPFSAYSPIVKLLSMPHLKYRKEYPTTGVLMGNTQVQWAIYDKAAEMRKRGVRSARPRPTFCAASCACEKAAL